MKRENLIKMGIVTIVVILFSFSDWSFAAEGTESLLDETAKWLHLIVSLLSWIWILFAQGAGEFMTNKWVYGEIIGLDAILWQYWNVIKNIANFGLGFYFVYTIFKGLIDSKGEVIKSVKDKLLWVLIAGIGIQASWFMVAAVVDMSTITLVAVSSLPSQIVSNSQQVKQSFDDNLKKQFNPSSDMKKFEKGIGISLFPSDRGAFDFITVDKERRLAEPMTEQELFDKIMPNGDNVSGPLHYLGLSILDTESLVSLNTATDNGVKATIFNIILQSLTTIVYSLEMMVLFVVAVMRVVYIWVFIVLSPIVFLLWCIKKADKNVKFNFLDSITKHFNLSSFFWNVFKPTLIVLGFSLAIIFVTVMSSIIQSSSKKTLDMGGVKTHSDKSSMGDGGNQKYVTVMEGDMVGLTIRGVGKTLLEFIMCIITVVLVYYIIKIAVLMGDGKDFLSTKIKTLQNDVGDALTKIPVMPVAGYDKEGKATTRYLSAGKVFSLGDDSIIGGKVAQYRGNVYDTYKEQQNIIDSWFGGNTIKTLKMADETAITDIRTSGKRGLEILKAQKEKIRALGNRAVSNGGLESGEGYGMFLNPNSQNRFWREEFERWLVNMESTKTQIVGDDALVWRKMVEWWNKEENQNQRSLQMMFGAVKGSIQAYVKLFGLDSSINDWEHLKDADISKKE